MLPEIIIPALLLGLGGSFHCIGMCGPLMLTSMFNQRKTSLPIKPWVSYHAGRISIYMVWGFVFGSIGSSIKWFGWQQNMSLSLGIGILTVLILIKVFPSLERRIGEIMWLDRIRKKIANKMLQKGSSTVLLGGIVNGLLPCGLVYVALAGATALQSPFHGALFMGVFGLGTLPLLALFTLAGNQIKGSVRRSLSAWYPLMIGVMAIMLIVRGMNLGNVFSPALLPNGKASIHCSNK